jgi:hypothetical protein
VFSVFKSFPQQSDPYSYPKHPSFQTPSTRLPIPPHIYCTPFHHRYEDPRLSVRDKESRLGFRSDASRWNRHTVVGAFVSVSSSILCERECVFDAQRCMVVWGSPEILYHVFDAQFSQGFGEGFTRCDVPSHEAVVVIQHGLPVGHDSHALPGTVHVG